MTGSLLRRHWWFMVMVSLLVVAVEIAEHRPLPFGQPNLDFWREVITYGLCVPLVGGLALAALSREPGAWAGVRGKRERSTPAVRAPHVLALEPTSIVGAGIAILLAHEADFEVVEIVSRDSDAVVRAIRQASPDIVVLDDAAGSVDADELLDRLEGLRLRLVLLSAASNLVRVYEQVSVNGTGELMALLRHRPNLGLTDLSAPIVRRGGRDRPQPGAIHGSGP